jgi:hypothetical protein
MSKRAVYLVLILICSSIFIGMLRKTDAALQPCLIARNVSDFINKSVLASRRCANGTDGDGCCLEIIREKILAGSSKIFEDDDVIDEWGNFLKRLVTE